MAKKIKKTDKKVKTPSKAPKPAKPPKKLAVPKKPAVAKKASAPKKVTVPAKKKVVAVKGSVKTSVVKTAVKAGLKAVLKAVSKKDDKKLVAKPSKADPKSALKKIDSKEELKAKKNKSLPENLAIPIEGKSKKVKKETETEDEVVIEVKAPIKDIVLTDAEGRELCRVKDCDQPWVVESYCRYHYLLFWKKIQNRKKILSEGKLEQYIEELTSRYPLKFLELIRKDLSSEPDFFSAIQELDIDESNNIDEFEDENFMEEVRGISSSDTERVDDEY